MRREPIKQDSQCAGRDRQKDGLPGRTFGGADIYKKTVSATYHPADFHRRERQAVTISALVEA